MPSLLLPAAVIALFALVLPVVIHIARRSEETPTDFAALRWLQQRPRPRSRLRIDEWPLLVVRLLLLTGIVLWLARPVLSEMNSDRPVVAFVPGVDPGAISIQDARMIWLAPGFPPLDQVPGGQIFPVSSLIRQLDAEIPATAPLTIVTPAIIEGADADRIRLSRKVDWRVVPGAMAKRPAPVTPMPPVIIRADAAHQDSVRYLRAAASVWQPVSNPSPIDVGSLDAPLPDPSHILMWLGTGSLPDSVRQWVMRGGETLVAADVIVPDTLPRADIWHDIHGLPLAQAMPLGRGHLIRLTRPVAPGTMPILLEPDFPTQLQAVLRPTRPIANAVYAADHAPQRGAQAFDRPPFDLRPWLAVAIALLLCVERWLATRRARADSP